MQKIKAFPNSYTEINNKKYDEYEEKYGVDNGWLPGSQQYNFQRLIEIQELAEVPFKDATILDVGCGTGDLSEFLSPFPIKKYVGIDIYPKALEKARKRYPQEEFIEGDLLTYPFNETFDYAFASGTFTVKMPIDNYRFVYSMVSKMWELTRVGLAFNVLTDTDEYPDETLFFYNTEKLANLLETIDSKASVLAAQDVGRDQAHFYMYRSKLLF